MPLAGAEILQDFPHVNNVDPAELLGSSVLGRDLMAKWWVAIEAGNLDESYRLRQLAMDFYSARVNGAVNVGQDIAHKHLYRMCPGAARDC